MRIKKLWLIWLVGMLGACAMNGYNGQVEKADMPILTEKQVQQEQATFEPMDTNILSHEVSVLTHEATQLGGVVMVNEQLVVVDSQANQLRVLNHNGELVRTVGTLGAKAGEFNMPTAIAYANNQLYIVDGQNYRIQVLTNDFEFVEEIPFATHYFTSPQETFRSIAVTSNGDIYLSSLSLDYAKIVYYSKDTQQFSEIGNNFCGSLVAKGDTVYALNIGLLYESSNSKGLSSSHNHIYTIKKDVIERIATLDIGLGASGLVPFGEQWLLFSNGYRQIMQYSADWQYEHSLAFFDDGQADFFGYIAPTAQGEVFVSLPQSNQLYDIK